MSSKCQPIKCKGAVFRFPNKPLTVEDVIVDTPKSGEVRVKLVASGVCRSDAGSIWGKRKDCVIPYGKPMINGHEGAGIIESIGSDVTEVSVGDHVVLLWMPQCNECPKCKNPKNNSCLVTLSRGNSEEGWIPADGKSRYHLAVDDSPVLTPSTNANLATFVEYAVVKQSMVAPIDKTLPLDIMGLFGCSIPTGFGAAANVAKVHKGSSCAIWGLGAVGMAVILGCKQMGAKTIIGVDINDEKYEMAKQFGCTHFINPNTSSEPTENLIKQLLEEGVDYTFDCIGNNLVVESAVKSLCPSGTFVAVGLLQPENTISVFPLKLLDGLTLTGALFGNYKGKDGVKELTQLYKHDQYFRDRINQFVSRRISLNQINEGFDSLKNGENVIRSLIIY